MKRRNISLYILAILSGLVSTALFSTTDASAKSCIDQYPQSAIYSGTANAEDGLYDVYVKLPKRGQQAQVTAYQETFDASGEASCRATKAVSASGDNWTKIARWSVRDQSISAYLASRQLPDEYGANRPVLMLVSAKQPVCQPSNGCTVAIDGQVGTIIPSTGALDEQGLIISIPRSIQSDTVERVEYYIDDVLAYTTDKLEPFDMRYVAFAGQKLSRVLQYNSGQVVVLNDMTSDTHSDSFWNFVFRVFYAGQSTTRWLVVIAIAALCAGGGYFGVRWFIGRRNWRIQHGFLKDSTQVQRSSAQLEKDYQKRNLVTSIKRGAKVTIGIVLVIALFSFVGRYFATINQVNGVSMEETLADNKYLLINRTPVTWDNLFGRQFIPKRGAIVTTKEVYGYQSSEQQNSDHRTLVKRVIGLPGERVLIDKGVVTIFNGEYPNGFNPDDGASWNKTMIADISTEVIDVQLRGNEVFVMGDNRLVSVDSRLNGPIALSSIQGELITPLSF